MAHLGRLTIYAGAGLSAADPTSLPGAAALASRIWRHLSSVFPLDGVSEWDLLAVADAVAEQPSGTALLRRTVLEVADMTGAPFNYAHEVISLLLCEGAVTVLETNYDNCIERAAQPEIPAVVRTPDELLHGAAKALLKAHGCATLPNTMRLTTAELAGIDLWANAVVQAQMSQDHVVFVGIGSVADYVRESLTAVVSVVGSEHLVLVDPGLADWDENDQLDWRLLLGDIAPAQRVATSADEFCDALLRAYVMEVCRRLTTLVESLADLHPQKLGVGRLLDAFFAEDAVSVLRWLRAVSWRPRAGQGVTSTTVTMQGLFAISGLLGATWTTGALGRDLVRLEPTDASAFAQAVTVLPLLAGEVVSGTDLVREAERRIAIARRSGVVLDDSEILVLCDGHVGTLGSAELTVGPDSDLDVVLTAAQPYVDGLAYDLVAEARADHLIDGSRPGRIVYIRASHLGVDS